MGMCTGKLRDARRGRDLYRLPSVQRMAPRGVASEYVGTRWREEPSVILANHSDHVVSYWVIQEEKKRTKEHRERITGSMGLQLTVGSSGGSVAGDVKRENEETLETEEVVHFLTRDHRMGPNGTTQPTHVVFPADCEEVRVYGYFERDGEWLPYKDKVYSIARGKKNVLLTALNSTIAPYAEKRVGARQR